MESNKSSIHWATQTFQRGAYTHKHSPALSKTDVTSPFIHPAGRSQRRQRTNPFE